ncbi:MAG TPA: hypothetical protein PKD83_11915 [Ignavibacteria bacterium]|nr:hypothetical protein [Ignavibacteria bacterium]
MKNITAIIILLILTVSYFAFQSMDDKRENNQNGNNDSELDGKTFTGKATEITPPDVDRMPIVYDETISFRDGKLFCESFNKYADAPSDINYTSEIDYRRAIAHTVVNFNSTSAGIVNGESVNLEIKGSVIAYKNLNGTLLITYPDKSEVKFLIEGIVN